MRLRKVVLSYDSDKMQDGTGAQLQRILGIRAVALKYRLSYIHSKIIDVTITPLDPFQTDSQKNFYLEVLNESIHLDDDFEGSIKRTVYIHNLSRRTLLTNIIKAYIRNETVLLKITLPYFVVNHSPEIYKLSVNRIVKHFVKQMEDSSIFHIVAHIRVGVNIQHIEPWRIDSRVLPIEYFCEQINKFLAEHKELDQKLIRITILTDSPESTFDYTIPENQIGEWQRAGYKIDAGKVHITATSFEETCFAQFEQLEIIRGGNPIDSLVVMANATIV